MRHVGDKGILLWTFKGNPSQKQNDKKAHGTGPFYVSCVHSGDER